MRIRSKGYKRGAPGSPEYPNNAGLRIFNPADSEHSTRRTHLNRRPKSVQVSPINLEEAGGSFVEDEKRRKLNKAARELLLDDSAWIDSPKLLESSGNNSEEKKFLYIGNLEDDVSKELGRMIQEYCQNTGQHMFDRLDGDKMVKGIISGKVMPWTRAKINENNEIESRREMRSYIGISQDDLQAIREMAAPAVTTDGLPRR